MSKCKHGYLSENCAVCALDLAFDSVDRQVRRYEAMDAQYEIAKEPRCPDCRSREIMTCSLAWVYRPYGPRISGSIPSRVTPFSGEQAPDGTPAYLITCANCGWRRPDTPDLRKALKEK